MDNSRFNHDLRVILMIARAALVICLIYSLWSHDVFISVMTAVFLTITLACKPQDFEDKIVVLDEWRKDG